MSKDRILVAFGFEHNHVDEVLEFSNEEHVDSFINGTRYGADKYGAGYVYAYQEGTRTEQEGNRAEHEFVGYYGECEDFIKRSNEAFEEYRKETK